MNRFRTALQPASQRIQRSLLHSSSRCDRPADEGKASREEAGPSELSRRLSASTPPTSTSAPKASNRFAAAVSSPERRHLVEANNARKALSKARTVGKYYSPGFLNLKSQETKEGLKPRKFPILGPSAAVAKKIDVLYQLGLRPGHVSLHDDSYKNPILLSEFVSEMGKIKGRKNTELTRRSQREVGKAIRRARSMGLMPVMSKDPSAWKIYPQK
ncbi:hypothetical protein CBS101457_003511 [Exobasidium rhododendri]|nr:hypothetical protein CBS101457_003511 [Exobasidium rhododendri]